MLAYHILHYNVLDVNTFHFFLVNVMHFSSNEIYCICKLSVNSICASIYYTEKCNTGYQFY